jgi:methionine--tRNA ligase beta chain
MEVKPLITIDDLNKIDIRVGTIENIQEVPNSEKLYKLTVNFGEFTRTIFSGIKKDFPDTSIIINKQALFVVNLQPRKMMGEMSEGMLFGIIAPDEKYTLSIPFDPVPNGSEAV